MPAEGRYAAVLSPLTWKHVLHTEVGESMETKLARIAEIAKERPQEKFTSLAHHINVDLLLMCHIEMQGN